MNQIIEVHSVSKSFGGVQANQDISLSVKEGIITGLIGPNGSGENYPLQFHSGTTSHR